ncbi:hypothetical protein MINT15_39500 [Saccharomonospora viridis]|uniref:Uncharacterized protein n=1 Tax=Saccharomonospora viridis TaxID=1852 RepID=A0A837D6T8_9PSEU|nr:hypothetical protein MINT15_39500 [Saccharomonospora viridis]
MTAFLVEPTDGARSRFSTHSPPGKRESTTTESHRSPTHL